MTFRIECSCGRRLKARDEFAGTLAECPDCGRPVDIPALEPELVESGDAPDGSDEFAVEITEFLQPPSASVSLPDVDHPPSVVRRMFEALLDPRSIQWMFMLGGGLLVLGLVIWLISLLDPDTKWIVAASLGAGTLVVYGLGIHLNLKTSHTVAGRALTFLACIVAPLNLWYYTGQDIITIGDHLWIGGLVCCLLFGFTVRLLRDPLFLYAVEAGVTLTAVLMLPVLNLVDDATFLRWDLCVGLMVLGVVSILLERAFAPEGDFPRKRFGLPLFWSGHLQIGTALLMLLSSQMFGWLPDLATMTLGSDWQNRFQPDNVFATAHLLAGGVWLLAACVYLYSDFVVRRIGIYVSAAAACVLLAIVTLVGPVLNAEGVILVLAGVAVAANLGQRRLTEGNERISYVVGQLSTVISTLPLLIGWILHLRATSSAEYLGGARSTDWLYVVAMLGVAIGARLSAWAYRNTSGGLEARYFFLSAGAVILAAAGLLRQFDLLEWGSQAPLLILVPIAYIIGARVWRGRSPEQPLGLVAHTAAAIILGHVFFSSVDVVRSILDPVHGETANILLGIVFVEAAVFYTLAGLFRRRSVNAWFAAAAACGAVWQFLGYFSIPTPYYAMLYSVLGLVLLATARSLGLAPADVYHVSGQQVKQLRGRGLTAYQSGTAILTVAFVAAGLQGLSTFLAGNATWLSNSGLLLTMLASLAAACLIPPHGSRRFYLATSIALSGLLFVTVGKELIENMSLWRQVELFSVVIGLASLIGSHVARFKESDDVPNETVGFGLFLGSALSVLPLSIAVFHGRFVADTNALQPTFDDFAVLGVSIVMLMTGLSWKLRSTTLFGGGSLLLTLIMLITSLAYHALAGIGAFLAIGGATLFVFGIVLSVYREKLLAIPDQFTNREGVFRVMNWK